MRRISASRQEYTTALTSELASARSRKYFSTARTLQDLQSRPSRSSTTWPGVQHTTNAPAGQKRGVGGWGGGGIDDGEQPGDLSEPLCAQAYTTQAPCRGRTARRGDTFL